jgi:hypothetical protein
MAYSINAGIQVSTDYNPDTGSGTWVPLTDHNRQPITYSPQRIEQVQRMANGTMRKMVIANKAIYDTSWTMLPSASYDMVADYHFGAGYIKAFYEANVFRPIWIKLTYANDATNGMSHRSSQLVTPTVANHQIIKVFITDFKYTINKRLTYIDYVDLSIQFTEV